MITPAEIEAMIEKHFPPNPIPSLGAPKWVLFTGCVGSGKTTARRKRFSNGFVTVDAGEIFHELTRGGLGAFGQNYVIEMGKMGVRILERAIREKRDIAMEILGEEPGMLQGFHDIIENFGYQVVLQTLECPAAEAYERRANASMNDPSYVSAKDTEPYHQKWVVEVWDKLLGSKKAE